MQSNGETKLFCNGYYSEILIIDPLTLQILYTLSSRVNPDWISAIDIVYPGKPQGNCSFIAESSYLLSIYRSDFYLFTLNFKFGLS